MNIASIAHETGDVILTGMLVASGVSLACVLISLWMAYRPSSITKGPSAPGPSLQGYVDEKSLPEPVRMLPDGVRGLLIDLDAARAARDRWKTEQAFTHTAWGEDGRVN